MTLFDTMLDNLEYATNALHDVTGFLALNRALREANIAIQQRWDDITRIECGFCVHDHPAGEQCVSGLFTPCGCVM